MIRTIADKEFTECRRDGRFLLAALLMLILLTAASLLGWCNYQDILEQADEAAEHDYQRFAQQDPKHPHDAAHYGVYAFKTPRPLTVVDGGIEPYVGASIMNGAHIQGEVEFPPAQDSTVLQRFGDLSPAVAVQTLLPLLVILLSYSAFAGEREQGTLRQLLSLGVKPGLVLWGKATGIGQALLAVLLPVAILGILATACLASAETRVDEILRAALLMLVYGVYLTILLFLALGVSAYCRSSRTALTVLLVFWGVTVFALPRAVLDVGGRFYPAPSNAEFWQRFQTELYQAWEINEAALQKKLLAEYQVKRIEDLPFDYTGQSMQAGDEAAWAVSERYGHQRYDIYARQNRLLEWGTLFSPASGVSLLSMALTGNDLIQQLAFTQQVEQHRRTMNTLLNDYIASHSQKGEQGWDNTAIKGDSRLWQSIPVFVYHPPAWNAVLRLHLLTISLLLAWAIAAFAFARYAVSRLSGV